MVSFNTDDIIAIGVVKIKKKKFLLMYAFVCRVAIDKTHKLDWPLRTLVSQMDSHMIYDILIWHAAGDNVCHLQTPIPP